MPNWTTGWSTSGSSGLARRASPRDGVGGPLFPAGASAPGWVAPLGGCITAAGGSTVAAYEQCRVSIPET